MDFLRVALALLAVGPFLTSCYGLVRLGDEEGALPDGGSVPNPADGGVEAADGEVEASRADAEASDAPDPVRRECTFAVSETVELPLGGDWSASAPEAVWTGDDLVVAFMGSHPWEHPVVSRARVDGQLGLIDEPTTIGEESHGWGEAAWTGERLGLCWHTDPGMEGRTGFRLHDRSGGRLGQRVDLDADGEACLDLAWDGDRFLAAWRHGTTEGDEYLIETTLQLLDRTGEPVGEPHRLSGEAYPGPSAKVVATEEGFLVAVPGQDEIRLLSVDEVGSVSLAAALPAPDAAFAHLARAEGRTAVAWLSGARYERLLHLVVLDDELSPVGPSRQITDETATVNGPRVDATRWGWVLVWGEALRDGPPERQAVMLHHLDRDGAPLQPRLAVYEGPISSYGGPDVEPVDEALLVAAAYRPPDGGLLEQLHLHRLQCLEDPGDRCSAQDAQVPAPSCDDEGTLGWVWTGADCLPLRGCEGDCLGRDCARLARSAWSCAMDRSACPGSR